MSDTPRITIKRAYLPPSEEDGTRILVDRLWPRGIAKDKLGAIWMKDAAPSTALRKWLHADESRWDDFVPRYRAELDAARMGRGEDAPERLVHLVRAVRAHEEHPPAAERRPHEVAQESQRELVRRIELEWGLRAELRMQGLEEPISETLARDVYHVVREALVNAMRHGEASAVRLQIARGLGDTLAITVADNGRGFPFQGRYTHHELAQYSLGPRTLLERVTSLNGTLAIDSSPSGARLDIAIPRFGGGA